MSGSGSSLGAVVLRPVLERAGWTDQRTAIARMARGLAFTWPATHATGILPAS